MDIYGSFYTNPGLFLQSRNPAVGCPRAAHLSNLGFTFWNRISYPFPVLYSPKYNLMHKFQHNSPHQFLGFTDCPKCPKKIPQFGLMFWDRSTAHSRHFFISSMHFNTKFPHKQPTNFWAVTAISYWVKRIKSIRSQALGPIKRPFKASSQLNIEKHLKCE